MDSHGPAHEGVPREKAALQSALYEQIFENSPDLISVVDRDGIYRVVNSTYLDMYDLSREQIVGQHVSKIMGQEAFENKVAPNLERCVAGETVNYQDWFSYSDPGKRYMDVCYYPLDIEDGVAQNIAVVVKDITEGKLAEDALRESEERYRVVVESAHDSIFVVDEQGRFVSANGVASKAMGFSPEDMAGKSMYELFPKEIADRQMESIASVFQSDKPLLGIETPTQTVLGTRWHSTNLTPVYNDGKIAAVLGIARDITSGREAEETIRTSEERYRLHFENISDVIYTLDKQYRLTAISPSVKNILGYEPEEMLGRRIDELNVLSPEDVERARENTFRTMSGETVPRSEYEFTAKDGTKKIIEIGTAPFYKGGEIIGGIDVARDITERKKMEEALRLSEERYHRIIDASHDMIVVLDEAGGIVFANDSWHRNASWTIADWEDLNLLDTIHVDERQRVSDGLRSALEGISIRDLEYRAITKDGGIKWITANADLIDWAGSDKALVVTARETTKRRRAEDALERSLSLLGATLEATADGILVIDLEGAVISFNRRFLSMWKIPEHMAAFGDENRAETFIADQLENPDDFGLILDDPPGWPDEENIELLKLKDGRIFERHTKSQKMGDADVGTVLSFRDITERKKSEEALKASEEKYRSIFMEAPDIFYTLDLESWLVTDANNYALEVLEYAPEHLGNVHISDIIHPDDFDLVVARLNEMTGSGARMPHMPLRFLTRTGKTLHIEQSGVIFRDENGLPRTFLGLAHDVTYRIEQDEAIRQRNEKIEALYEVARAVNETLDMKQLAALMLDIVPRMTNSATMAIYLLNEESGKFDYLAHHGVPQKTVDATNHLDPNEGIHSYVVKNREPLLIDDVLKHPDLTRPEHVNQTSIGGAIAAPLIIEDEVAGFLWVSREPGNPYDRDDLDLVDAMARHIGTAISNAKLYEQVLQRETRLETILETSRDGIVVVSPDRKIAYRNKAIMSIFGYDETDNPDEFRTTDFFAPRDTDLMDGLRKELDRQNEIEGSIALTGKRKDGSTFDAETRLGTFLENDKLYSVAIVRDVTEQNRLRFQLEQSSKLAAIGELAAGVAHEINNPIATLDIRTGLMRDVLGDEREKLTGEFVVEMEEFLDIVESQVQRCQSVTENLLSFGRSPEGRALEYEINALLEKTIEFICGLTDKKPRIELKTDERIPLFFGDPNRLQQVFVNLLNNALKAIEPEGSIDIATSLDPDGNVCIKFKDDGPGIEPEILTRIFDPFFTTDSDSGGTGLGLSISYYIAKEMGGMIDVESSLGMGATFSLILPDATRSPKGATDNA